MAGSCVVRAYVSNGESIFVLTWLAITFRNLIFRSDDCLTRGHAPRCILPTTHLASRILLLRFSQPPRHCFLLLANGFILPLLRRLLCLDLCAALHQLGNVKLRCVKGSTDDTRIELNAPRRFTSPRLPHPTTIGRLRTSRACQAH